MIELENATTATEVRETVRRKEEAIVQHDTVKLEVKRLRDLLSARADEVPIPLLVHPYWFSVFTLICAQVFSLENRKQQLQLSMREREKEVTLTFFQMPLSVCVF